MKDQTNVIARAAEPIEAISIHVMRNLFQHLFTVLGSRKKLGMTLLIRAFCTLRVFAMTMTIFIVISSSVNAGIFTDDMGRKIELSEVPSRIISLAPSITETLFYLDLGDRIVGVTDFCNYPEEARKKPSIGFIISPDIEKIVSLKPDLVFATAEGNRPDVVETLKRVGIKVYVLDPHHLEDIFREVLSIGEMTGQIDTAREKVKDLRGKIETIQKRAEGMKRVKILYLISIDPMISAGPGSFIHDLIEIAGGENVAAQSVTRYPRMQMEEIVIKDPEVILGPPDIIENVRAWKRKWDKISAVRHNRIYSIDPDIISRPGPRIVEGLEQVYQYIHANSNFKNQILK